MAGGKSARMKENKLLIKIAGKRIIDHTISVISSLFPVYVVGKENLNHYIDNRSFIVDLYSVSAPLVGLYSAIRTVDAEAVFLISGDMPFAKADLILFLESQLSKDIDAVVPFYERPQTTFAFYKKSCLETILKAIEDAQLSLKGILMTLKVKYIYEEKMRPFDQNLISFFNINTRKQLEIGKKIILNSQAVNSCIKNLNPKLY
ncbi:MAG: molybdenum cofactor guanylyltransferase [bacterium]|nr:MAG: molybdenum cofactor guanylyltransferase [bacterium]